MALTEDLKIYRSMYDLQGKLREARRSFDKEYKYTDGVEMICKAMRCLALVHYANEDRHKGAREEHLAEFLIEFDILKTIIMVCRDGRQFKKASMLGDIFILTADVEAQATAWRRSASRKPEPQED